MLDLSSEEIRILKENLPEAPPLYYNSWEEPYYVKLADLGLMYDVISEGQTWYYTSEKGRRHLSCYEMKQKRYFWNKEI